MEPECTLPNSKNTRRNSLSPVTSIQTILSFTFLQINFNIILLDEDQFLYFTPTNSNCSPALTFPHPNPVSISPLPHKSYFDNVYSTFFEYSDYPSTGFGYVYEVFVICHAEYIY